MMWSFKNAFVFQRTMRSTSYGITVLEELQSLGDREQRTVSQFLYETDHPYL